MTHAARETVVNLTMSEPEAQFLRTLLGSLSPHDFASDHVVFNLVRAKHPDHIVHNASIAGALLTLLGTGLGGDER